MRRGPQQSRNSPQQSTIVRNSSQTSPKQLATVRSSSQQSRNGPETVRNSPETVRNSLQHSRNSPQQSATLRNSRATARNSPKQPRRREIFYQSGSFFNTMSGSSGGNAGDGRGGGRRPLPGLSCRPRGCRTPGRRLEAVGFCVAAGVRQTSLH